MKNKNSNRMKLLAVINRKGHGTVALPGI